MAKDETQIVHIWDDPESRVQFLETLLKGKEWQAVIYDTPDFNEDIAQTGPHPLTAHAEQFVQKGYKATLGRDANGIPILLLTHFGGDTSLLKSIREMGMVKGVGHKITHLGEPLGDAMAKTKSLFKHIASDKARAIGAFYMIGDVILSLSGLGNKSADGENKGFKDPANILESTMGVAATIQSLIYMGFAKETSQATFDELMQKAKEADAAGTALVDSSLWQAKEDGKRIKGPVTLAKQVLKDKPLESGAAVQLLGKAGLIGAGGIRLARSGSIADPAEKAKMRSGAVKDIITALNSMTGWTLLMKKSQEVAESEKAPWSSPKRLWQEVQASPNKFASMFLGAASLSGVAAAATKGNKIQMAGNSTYLVGDAIMFVTKNADYGSAGRANADVMAAAAAKFVQASPMVMGKDVQQQFVGQLSAYLAERSLDTVGRKEKRAIAPEEVTELTGKIAHGIAARLPTVHNHTYEVAGKAAAVLSHFHPQVAGNMADALAEAISQSPTVMMDAAEMKAHILQQVEYPKALSEAFVSVEDIAQPLSDLIHVIPGGATAENANRFFDVVSGRLSANMEANAQQVENAVNADAQKEVAKAEQQVASQKTNSR